MEFKKRKLKVIFDGQAFELAYPSLKMLKGYQKESKEVKEDSQESIEKVQSFLSKLGLPCEVSDEMEPEHLTKIVNEISGQKKA